MPRTGVGWRRPGARSRPPRPRWARRAGGPARSCASASPCRAARGGARRAGRHARAGRAGRRSGHPFPARERGGGRAEARGRSKCSSSNEATRGGDRAHVPRRDPRRDRRLHVRLRQGLLVSLHRPARVPQLPHHEPAVRGLAQERAPPHRDLRGLPPAARRPGKWVAKADQGFRHSLAFTLQNFKEPIEIKPWDRRIVQVNCVRCHADFVHAVVGRRARQTLDCLHCHAGAGHGAGG